MAKNTDFGFAPDEVADDSLKDLYAMYTDEQLSEVYEQAVDWRDWFECEMINMEFDRRAQIR